MDKNVNLQKDLAKAGLAGSASGLSLFSSSSKELLSGGGIPHDKKLHAGGCFTITTALGAIRLPPYLAATVTFVGATVGKEIVWDYMLGRDNPEFKDALANLSGSLAGYTALKGINAVKDNIKPNDTKQLKQQPTEA